MQILLLLLILTLIIRLTSSSPPLDPVACSNGMSNCTVTNANGYFPDRSICRAANAIYPRTEQELLAAVAAAAVAKRKVKVATRYSHSFTKLTCPGGRDGTIISTRWLNRTVQIDGKKGLLTVESGMVLSDLMRVAAAAGLCLPNSPYWSAVTVGGLLATGAHGSSLWGKGSAVHEYVVGIRIVTPAPASQGFAVVRELGADHPDLDAVKVSLGVLGVISQVTLALQPLFKRSVTFVTRDESDLADQVAAWGGLHEFGDIRWLPHQRKVIYREDNRVDISSPGNGLNDFPAFWSLPAHEIVAARVEEERREEDNGGTDDDARCSAAQQSTVALERQGHGFTNDGVSFTSYPVVGYQHRMQASSACVDSPEDGLQSACFWDPRLRGPSLYNPAFTVALSRAPSFLADVWRLRDLHPSAFCTLHGAMGVQMRYVKASSAYLGKPEDSIAVDIAYYRSRTRGVPRAHADVVDELEQMALRKYGGVPHWGKSRNFAFDGAIARYPKAGEFLEVKDRYDPDGIFSSEWSDQVLGIKGSPIVVGKGCAIEGLCVCSDDSHCAPEQGYFCRPGKVYAEARVCRFEEDNEARIDDEL
ncbi:L-gulonolactone oxidase 2 [Setaria italica]|uniref:L-gulonolactone oxidase 2 n=1 Tax=Setaria italica TaxID=4555 RepID=UPI00035144E5|nr:L-gulonolactone oxidase 2 [Setaria italica]